MRKCPICGSEAGELDMTGDAEGFDCHRDGKFKVAGTALEVKRSASREEWESALTLARKRTMGGEWPTINTYDF